MKIAIASDHAGFELKNNLLSLLRNEGYELIDFGAESFNPDDDYPDFIGKASEYVSENGGFGIVIGKSGAGEAIVANKYKGVRAVLCVNEENVKLSREHNDANVLSIGSILTDPEEAKKLVLLFINTPFSQEERHKRRIEKIKKIEENS